MRLRATVASVSSLREEGIVFHTLGTYRVHSLSFGTGPGTLVGIAGSFADWEIWAPTFELLCPRWRVVAFDHNGVGETKVSLEDITHEDRLDTLFSVLDAHAIDRCVLAGDSSNATVAIEAVLRCPERFDGLAIVNGSAWDFDRPAVQRFVAGLRAHFEATIDFFVDYVFPEPDTGHLKQWLRDIIIRTGPDAAARILESYFSLDFRPRLCDITVPTMIVHGMLDALSETSLSDAHALAGLIPGAELHLLDDAGHLSLLSRPSRVADLLDRFLAANANGGNSHSEG
jgi:pimeloyl-ACP methyl ester carboxylesterase